MAEGSDGGGRGWGPRLAEEAGLGPRRETTSTVVVTGASSGVGRAAVQAWGRRGARVGLLARGKEGLEGARRDVEAAGGEALVQLTDVADPDQVEAAAAAVEERFGPIDVWVNNAMTSVFAPLSDVTAEEFRRVTEVDYLGTVYGTMAALRRMRPRDRGVIVQVGSALAYRGIPLQSAYCGSKHAIQGFTESLRCELLHDGSGVQVTMVQLPALNTPQFDHVEARLPGRPQPVPPIYQPEVAAAAIVWAAEHPGRRETWVGAPSAATILANKFAAGLLDRYLARTGYESQQADEPARNGPTNLWRAVPGDPGAHGRFDEQSKSGSLQVLASRYRPGLTAAAAAAVLTAARRARSRRR